MPSYTQTIARAIRKGYDVLDGDAASELERDLTELHDSLATVTRERDDLHTGLNSVATERADVIDALKATQSKLRECAKRSMCLAEQRNQAVALLRLAKNAVSYRDIPHRAINTFLSSLPASNGGA